MEIDHSRTRATPAADAPLANRPGVPMEAPPRARGDTHIPRQETGRRRLKRKGLAELTPVYGTAQPPRGISGVLRRGAYQIPDHSALHWLALLFADRVDVMEGYVTQGIGPEGWDALRRRVRNNPVPFLTMGMLAGLAVRRALR